MKILFYDWALHSVGGGQKFNCKIVEHLSKNHEITLLTLFPVNKKQLENYYSVNLAKIKIASLYKQTKINPTLLKILASKEVSTLSKKYDLFFNGDAQETVFPRAKHNIMYAHFFEPKWYRPATSFFDFIKLLAIYLLKTLKGNYSRRYKIYCNSNYTKDWLKRLWKANADIIYPPVDLPKKIGKKQNIIISIGRITPDKNYEFVIEIFKKAYNKIKNYKLLICGKGDNDTYLKKLKILAKGYPVEFLTNLAQAQLSEIYSKSKIFVQAKGLNIDENKYPGLFEHFGMTTAEAMAHGAIPIVLDKAGYKEIVTNDTGFKFKDKQQAIQDLLKLAEDKKLFSKMSKSGIQRAKMFSTQRMGKQIDDAINSL